MSVTTCYRAVGAIMSPGRNRTIVQPGEILDPNVFTPAMCIGHLESGHAEEVRVVGNPDADGKVPAIVLAKELPPVVMVGKWPFSPDQLSRRSLKSLNTLIAERDPKVHPYSRKDEAIKHLSQDWKPDA